MLWTLCLTLEEKPASRLFCDKDFILLGCARTSYRNIDDIQRINRHKILKNFRKNEGHGGACL